MVGPHLLPLPGVNVDTRLIAANSIMQLSVVELEQVIRRELDENPALELVERPSCPGCGGPLRFGCCDRCSSTDFTFQKFSDHAEGAFPSGLSRVSDSDADSLGALPAPLILSEQLLAQLRLTLDRADHEIALYLVESLDEHGYLTLSVEEVAQTLHVEPARVDAVLKELHLLDPIGIGARSAVECLLIQTERLAERGILPPPSTRAIIEHYLEALGHHQFEHIRLALNVSRREVEAAFIFIRTHLHPYPAYHYSAQNGASRTATPPLVPSVVIQKNSASEASYEIEIVEPQRFLLRLNPLYQQMRQRPDLMRSPGEFDHVVHFLDRARLFMSQLQRRCLLLCKVATYLVGYQRKFLDHGPLYLRPLTQKRVAQELGVHVSTISRVIASKFAQFPSREIVPLSHFFAGELRVQELISRIIAHETEPLSDARIARLLGEDYGITLSRQMVANYRASLAIPAARQRAVLRRA